MGTKITKKNDERIGLNLNPKHKNKTTKTKQHKNTKSKVNNKSV
jgi:hypothetical protein